MKSGRALTLPIVTSYVTLTVLLATASPAFAAGGTLGAAKEWHYWIAPVLFASAVFVMLVALPLGYLFKVWLPKHRGR